MDTCRTLRATPTNIPATPCLWPWMPFPILLQPICFFPPTFITVDSCQTFLFPYPSYTSTLYLWVYALPSPHSHTPTPYLPSGFKWTVPVPWFIIHSLSLVCSACLLPVEVVHVTPVVYCLCDIYTCTFYCAYPHTYYPSLIYHHYPTLPYVLADPFLRLHLYITCSPCTTYHPIPTTYDSLLWVSFLYGVSFCFPSIFSTAHTRLLFSWFTFIHLPYLYILPSSLYLATTTITYLVCSSSYATYTGFLLCPCMPAFLPTTPMPFLISSLPYVGSGLSVLLVLGGSILPVALCRCWNSLVLPLPAYTDITHPTHTPFPTPALPTY